MTRKTPSFLSQMGERGEHHLADFDAWLQARDIAWQRLAAGDVAGLTPELAYTIFASEEPVRWGELYLFEPDSGDPYRFFDYQRESAAAWDQNCVHEDGAEVGKTREITLLVAWAGATSMGFRRGKCDSLVGAPQQTHLNDIIDAIERQVEADQRYNGGGYLGAMWEKPRRTPHTQLRLRAPNVRKPDHPVLNCIEFRPGGVDGESFRGVHVNGFAMIDEAAKLKRKEHWSEFNRALKPGAIARYYSVPDGDRTSQFYAFCQSAVPGLKKNEAGFRKFQWPKTLMPAPFWSKEREAFFIQLYGGRDTPGYQRNVLGLWGDAEDPVFRWADLQPNIRDLPAWRMIDLSIDAPNSALRISVRRIDITTDSGKMVARDAWLCDTALDLSDFRGDDESRVRALRDALAPWIDTPRGGVFYAGADLGERNDPTEIIISEQIGPRLVDALRIRAKGFAYHLQEDLIFVLDEMFARLPHYGVDLGSAGTAVVKNLCSVDRFASAHFEERISGFHFQSTVECIDEDGNVLESRDDKGDTVTMRAPAKHHATQCVVSRLQRSGYGLPYDTEALNMMTSHTARAGAKWPIYGKTNDHNIDARRLQMLRKLYDAPVAADVFSSGTHDRRSAA